MTTPLAPRVSVIIPAYNAAQTIGLCLDALAAQTLPRDEYEVIVVDDGSADATRELAAARGARVISQSNAGAAAARNLGARHARGEIVLFCDADSVPDARWLAAMIEPFGDANIAGASGEKKTHQTNWMAQFVQAEYDYRYERIASHRRIDFVDSSTAAYRREIFLANGGFDTTLLDAEDTELSYRLSERGHAMVLAPDAIVWHTHPEALVEYLTRKYRYALWRARVYARFPRKAASDTRTPQTQKLQAGLAALLALTGLGGFVWSGLFWVAALMLVLFLATTLPFVRWCWRSNRRVALVAPAVLWLAAYPTGLGVLVGFLNRRGH